jgi:hypothetical protein
MGSTRHRTDAQRLQFGSLIHTPAALRFKRCRAVPQLTLHGTACLLLETARRRTSQVTERRLRQFRSGDFGCGISEWIIDNARRRSDELHVRIAERRQYNSARRINFFSRSGFGQILDATSRANVRDDPVRDQQRAIFDNSQVAQGVSAPWAGWPM